MNFHNLTAVYLIMLLEGLTLSKAIITDNFKREWFRVCYIMCSEQFIWKQKILSSNRCYKRLKGYAIHTSYTRE